MSDIDKVFAGSIPNLYETYLVPLIFQPYADDVALRLKAIAPARLLEIAAGTGVVTRALATALDTTSIVATDLNQAMLDHAIAYCEGTPLRNEIEARDASRLVEATNVATAALVKRYGSGPIDGKIQAHVVTVRKEGAA